MHHVELAHGPAWRRALRARPWSAWCQWFRTRAHFNANGRGLGFQVVPSFRQKTKLSRQGFGFKFRDCFVAADSSTNSDAGRRRRGHAAHAFAAHTAPRTRPRVTAATAVPSFRCQLPLRQRIHAAPSLGIRANHLPRASDPSGPTGHPPCGAALPAEAARAAAARRLRRRRGSPS